MESWWYAALAIGVAAFSAVVARAMVRRGPLDQPNGRKVHVRPVPKGGGLGTVLATLAVLAWQSRTDPALAALATGLLGGGALIATVAFLDDLRDWPFTVKLAAQAAAAALVAGSGVWVHAVGPIPLGVAGPVLTFGWILYVTNAVNFMDGVNGLAAGVCAIAGVALVIAVPGGVGLAGLLLAAGLAGFLPFNFPHARIFMGDVGSQFCGFVLAVLAIAAARTAPDALLVVPLALGVLLLDVAFTLVRRAWAGERVTEGHRGHLYQLAHRAGVPVPVVTGAVWAMSAWGAACAALPAGIAIPLALAPPVLAGMWVLRRARQRLAAW